MLFVCSGIRWNMVEWMWKFRVSILLVYSQGGCEVVKGGWDVRQLAVISWDYVIHCLR